MARQDVERGFPVHRLNGTGLQLPCLRSSRVREFHQLLSRRILNSDGFSE